MAAALTLVQAGWCGDWQQKAEISSGGALDSFGESAAIDGAQLIVGAIENSTRTGSAYIYTCDGANWIQQAKLNSTNGTAYDQFGVAVDINGSNAIVGALYTDNPTNAGSAYIFLRTGTNWNQQVELRAAVPNVGDLFGYSVGIAGDRAIVGVPYDDSANTNAGAAYIFTRAAGNWVREAILVSPTAGINDLFGRAVAVDGDTVAVGAPYDSSGAAAYIFVRVGTNWIQQAKLQWGTKTGYDVDISGERMITGNHESEASKGAAYIFLRTGTNWACQASLTASDGAAGDNFGERVGIYSDFAIVGTMWQNSSRGAAYIFKRNAAQWTQQAKLTASDGAANDQFSSALAIDGATAVSGAHGHDQPVSGCGTAYIFTLPAGTIFAIR